MTNFEKMQEMDVDELGYFLDKHEWKMVCTAKIPDGFILKVKKTTPYCSFNQNYDCCSYRTGDFCELRIKEFIEKEVD